MRALVLESYDVVVRWVARAGHERHAPVATWLAGEVRGVNGYRTQVTRACACTVKDEPGHRLDVDGVAAPRWWDDVSDEARAWLLEHPREAVPSWVWVPLVKAGGSVYSVQWDGGDPSGMSLVLADEEWLRFQRALDAAR